MPINSIKNAKGDIFFDYPDTHPKEIAHFHPIRKWETFFSKENAPILKGKKTNNVLNLIAVLALKGKSSIGEVAENLGEEKHGNQSKDLRRLIKGRGPTKSHVGNKGLIERGYVKPVGYKMGKNNYEELFFLTLKACIFSTGYHFNNDETADFIKNAASNHIFFAYLKSILEKTSVDFAVDVFITPIRELINNGTIQLNERFDLDFFFDSIARKIGEKVDQKYNHFAIRYMHFHSPSPHQDWLEKENGIIYENTAIEKTKLIQTQKFLQILIENTFYGNYNDWHHKMNSYFYPRKKEKEFYFYFADEMVFRSKKWVENGNSYQVRDRDKDKQNDFLELFGENKNDIPKKAWRVDLNSEVTLLGKVMRAVHFAFFTADGLAIPIKHPQKIPRSVYNKKNSLMTEIKTNLSMTPVE